MEENFIVIAQMPVGRDTVRYLPRYPAATGTGLHLSAVPFSLASLKKGEARYRMVPCSGRGSRTPSRGFGDRWFTVNRYPFVSNYTLFELICLFMLGYFSAVFTELFK